MGILAGARAEAAVSIASDHVEVQIQDADPRTLTLFRAHETGEHAVLAEEAWRIGIRALASAFAQVEEGRLKDVGHALVQDVEKQLKDHIERQEKSVTAVLQRYFSPEDGQLTERLKRLLEDDGELARVLRAHVAPDRSVLAETLAQRVGETSPLFKLLSPTDSEGVIQQMEKRFEQALETHEKSVQKALDPATDGTPVARFLAKLKGDLKEAGDDQEKVLKALTAAIDPNDEESLINRLQRDVQKANRDLLTAINPDVEGSPMSTIKRTLTTLLEKQIEENREFREKADERQKRFEIEVKEALARIEQRKRDAERSTHGGLEFEADVLDFLANAVAGGPYIVEETGNTVGHLRGSKVGDQVIRFSGEHAFAGCGLVVEAKRAGNYTVANALGELDEAKKNRGCEVGLFVIAEGHRTRGFPRFARYGSNMLVAWDPEDPETNPYLHAALLAGLSLATRTRARDEGDIAALHDVEQRILKEVQRLEEMGRLVGNIQRDAGKIEGEIRTGTRQLNVLVAKANEVLAALKVAVQAEDEERASPIILDDDSFPRAGPHPTALQGSIAAPVPVAARAVETDAPTSEESTGGVRSAAAWLADPDAWPMEEVFLGAERYRKEELQRLLAARTQDDASTELARELLAAELNDEAGSLPEAADDARYEAHDLLGDFDGRLPFSLGPEAEPGRQMSRLAARLRGFNVGEPERHA